MPLLTVVGPLRVFVPSKATSPSPPTVKLPGPLTEPVTMSARFCPTAHVWAAFSTNGELMVSLLIAESMSMPPELTDSVPPPMERGGVSSKDKLFTVVFVANVMLKLPRLK